MSSFSVEKKVKEIADICLERSYQTFEADMDKVIASLSREQTISVLKSNAMKDLIKNVAVHNWYLDRGLVRIVKRYPSAGDTILKDSPCDHISHFCISNGFYTDLSLINDAALNESMPETQLYAAHICDFKTLKKIKSSSNNKVRHIALQRLGPVESLDEMLDDKIASVREMGARYAPYGYNKLSSMTKEIAKGVFSILVDKMSFEDIPMILANRNLKNHWTQKKLEERMNRGY